MLSPCAVNEVMPGRRSVFKNWADYCRVEMEKLFIWNSRSLKLLTDKFYSQCKHGRQRQQALSTYMILTSWPNPDIRTRRCDKHVHAA